METATETTATVSAVAADVAATAATDAARESSIAASAAESAAASAAHVEAVVETVAANVQEVANVHAEVAVRNAAENVITQIQEDLERENTWMAQRLLKLETDIAGLNSLLQSLSLTLQTVTESQQLILQRVPEKKTEAEKPEGSGEAAQEVPKTPPAENKAVKRFLKI